MRMWMINPRWLCNKHLIGEHGEIHKHRHNFVKKHSITGRITPVVQIEPESMKTRHDALAAELLRRGMRHDSPYEQPDINYLPIEQRTAKVNIAESSFSLCSRCVVCRKKISGEES